MQMMMCNGAIDEDSESQCDTGRFAYIPYFLWDFSRNMCSGLYCMIQ